MWAYSDDTTLSSNNLRLLTNALMVLGPGRFTNCPVFLTSSKYILQFVYKVAMKVGCCVPWISLMTRRIWGLSVSVTMQGRIRACPFPNAKQDTLVIPQSQTRKTVIPAIEVQNMRLKCTCYFQRSLIFMNSPEDKMRGKISPQLCCKLLGAENISVYLRTSPAPAAVLAYNRHLRCLLTVHDMILRFTSQWLK